MKNRLPSARLLSLAPAEPLSEPRRRAEHLLASTAPRAKANGFTVRSVQDPLALSAFRFDLAPRKLSLRFCLECVKACPKKTL